MPLNMALRERFKNNRRLVGYFSYFIMSIQLLLTKIEFNIFAAIAVILLPFGALRYTSFLFQRAVSCVFSFGIKLMLCYFMLGIVERQSDALLKGFEYGGKPLNSVCSSVRPSATWLSGI